MNTPVDPLESVRAVITGLVHRTDAKRWAALRELFAPQVTTDYTSLFGGTPQTQASEALVESWRGALAHVTTQHLLGPIHVRLEGDSATATCHVRAMHFAKGASGGEHWEVLGHYVFALGRSPDGFRIQHMTLQTLLQIGNRNLLAETS